MLEAWKKQLASKKPVLLITLLKSKLLPIWHCSLLFVLVLIYSPNLRQSDHTYFSKLTPDHSNKFLFDDKFARDPKASFVTHVPRKNIDGCCERRPGVEGATTKKKNCTHSEHTHVRKYLTRANFIPQCILILFDVKI